MSDAANTITPLDNAIWHALNSLHAPLARTHGDAMCYPSDVSPMAAVREPTASALRDLSHLIAADEHVAVVTAGELEVPEELQVQEAIDLYQMSCIAVTESPAADSAIRLTPSDVPEMLALTAATKPGPFLPRTIAMGRYFGIRASDGTLAAMAGERLRLDKFTEISAVCTDPAYRGHGHARALVAMLARDILASGKTPFLHCTLDNPAQHLYRKVGFDIRRQLRVHVLTRPTPGV